MHTIEELLGCKYDTLKKYILNQEPFMLEALKDKRIKEKLINSESRYDLIWLVQEMPDEYAYQLFDDEGIKILSQTPELFDKMNGILTCGKKYVNKLFEKPEFCKLVSDNLDNLKSYLYTIEEQGALKFIKYIQENNPQKLKPLLINLNKDVQEKVVKEITLPTDVLTYCIVSLTPKASEYLVNNDFRITSLRDYSFDDLHQIFSKEFHLKTGLLEDKIFLKKIVSMSNVKDYRFLINALAKANDITEIERLRKDYYTSEMISYNPEFKMLEKYCLCYQEICKMIDNDNMDSSKLNDVMNKCFNFFGSGQDKWIVGQKIWNYLTSKDKNGLKKFFQEESNLQISNMIIDYHFEDVPHNFFLDIRQLCNFQLKEGRTLSDEDLSIYQRLSKIDSLSYEEKMLLHQELQKDNWIDKHYDVFRETKDKAATLIKNQMLNNESVLGYCNLKLTQESGVPIYELDGQDFFALVKSLRVSKDNVLAPKDIYYYVDGSSFSLDGSNKLSTFYNPHEYYNLIYGDFPIEQVIHMYPVDSFSKYDRSFKSKATKRVYELYTPTELVEKSRDYNEIIIAQNNQRRKDDEVNDNLKNPTILGIYCYDEITPNDIESAKNLGVGIVVIRTKKYDIQNDNRLTMMETLSPAYSERHVKNIDYLTSVHDDDMVTRRTK